jgi:hypothetical protein
MQTGSSIRTTWRNSIHLLPRVRFSSFFLCQLIDRTFLRLDFELCKRDPQTHQIFGSIAVAEMKAFLCVALSIMGSRAVMTFVL